MVLAAYFQAVTIDIIKTHFTTVFQLLEDMGDYGYPLLTEPNSLMTLVRVPTVANRLTSIISGNSNVSDFLPGNALSSISWRRKDAQYVQNEVICDCVERLNCIVDSGGRTIRCQVRGVLYYRCFVNGTPDITLEFNTPSLLVNPSFHPCVRTKTWDTSSVLSFIPPDGSFILMEYSLNENTNVNVPIYCKPIITYNEEGGSVEGRIECMVGTRFAPVVDHKPFLPLDNIHLYIPFPESVSMVSFTVNTGSALFDPATRKLKWDIGRMPDLTTPQLTGKILLKHGAHIPKDKTTISVLFSAPGRTVSGLQIKNFRITNMGDTKVNSQYRKCIQNGTFEVRV